MRFTLIINDKTIMHFNLKCCADLYQQIYGGVIIDNLKD